MFHKFSIAILLLPVIAVESAIHMVNKAPPSPVSSDSIGSSWENPYINLQDALETAQSGDVIWVAEGTYTPMDGKDSDNEEYPREQSFQLKSNVSLYGGFKGYEDFIAQRAGDANRTILSGEIDDDSTYWSLHVLSGRNLTGSVTMDGFRIEKGNANGVKYVVTDSNESINTYGAGGGIFLWECSSNFTIKNCSFFSNTSSFEEKLAENESTRDHSGSCIYSYNDENLAYPSFTLSDCLFKNNKGESIIFCGNRSIDMSREKIEKETNFTGSNLDFINNEGGSLTIKAEQLNLNSCRFLNNSDATGKLISATYHQDSVNSDSIIGYRYDSGNNFVYLQECYFSGNDRCEIFIGCKSGSISNSIFTNNGTQSDSGDSNILNLFAGEMKLMELIFDSNFPNCTQLNPVQVNTRDYVSQKHYLTKPNYRISKSKFSYNKGHALSCDYSPPNVNDIVKNTEMVTTLIEDSNFTFNDSYAAHSDAPLVVRGCSFISNTSKSKGGAISASSMYVSNSIFKNNIAYEAGGAIHLEGIKGANQAFNDFEEHLRPVVHVQNSIFDSNVAGLDGGAISGWDSGYSDDLDSDQLNYFELTPVDQRKYALLLNVSNCIFYGNEAQRGGAFSGFGALINCTFTQNSAYSSAAVFCPFSAHPQIAYTSLTNCILWDNLNSYNSNDRHGIWNSWNLGNQFQSLPAEFRIPQYPGDPRASKTNGQGKLEENIHVYFDQKNDTPILAHNWNDNSNPLQAAFSANPMFVNPSDPDGADNIWMTEDDGLCLQAGSPAIDVGNSNFLSFDGCDLDGDETFNESIPIDLLGNYRIFGTIDLGAYEYRPGNALSGAPNWFSLDWFGSYFEHDSNANWIFHYDLGRWVYMSDWSPTGVFLYIDGLGWTWTKEGVYPHLYQFSEDTWIYLSVQNENPDRYYDQTLREWITF